MKNVLGKESRSFYMGIAMIWIIGYHILIFHNSQFHSLARPFMHLFAEGYVGVDIFMFFSAYGLSHSIERRPILDFYKQRVIRIYPEYILFLIVCVIMFKINIYDGIIGMFYQFTSLSLFSSPPVFNGEWFTPAIINLYMVFPLVYYTVSLVNRRFRIYGQIGLLALMVLFVYLFSSVIDGRYLGRFPIIVIGILTYLNEQQGKTRNLLCIYVVASICIFVVDRNNVRLSLAIPLIFYGINYLNLNLKGSKANLIKKIGIYSFEFYLAQSICISLCSGMSILYVLLIMTIGSIGGAWMFHRANRCILKVIDG